MKGLENTDKITSASDSGLAKVEPKEVVQSTTTKPIANMSITKAKQEMAAIELQIDSLEEDEQERLYSYYLELSNWINEVASLESQAIEGITAKYFQDRLNAQQQLVSNFQMMGEHSQQILDGLRGRQEDRFRQLREKFAQFS